MARCRHQWSRWVRSGVFDQRRFSRCVKCGETEWRLPTAAEETADLEEDMRRSRNEAMALRALDEDDDD